MAKNVAFRRLYTWDDLLGLGKTPAEIRWAERTGKIRRATRSVYAKGSEPVVALDAARADALAMDGIAVGAFAGALHNYDGVQFVPEILVGASSSVKRTGVRRVRVLPANTVEIGQVRCLSAGDTLRSLAGTLDDARWEQAIEAALRQGEIDPNELVAWINARSAGASRILRVINARGGLAAAPTESLLETLSFQLVRNAGLPVPERQVEVYDEEGNFVARVDQAWTDLGAFLELDGQQHKNQPVYDASRETGVAAATGWLCGRLTWHEVTRTPVATARRLKKLLAQARARPLSAVGGLPTKVL